MLVVLRQDTGGDDITPGTAFSLVDQRCRKDTSGSCSEVDGPALLEHPRKDVLVVPDSDDVLDDQRSSARDCSDRCPMVGVLPANARVLFVKTNHVGRLDRISTRVVQPGAEVFKGSQTVTAELEIVRAASGAGVSKVECLLSVIRCSWVFLSIIQFSCMHATVDNGLTTVGNRHLTHTETIEHLSTVIPHVVDSHPLPIVKPDSEPPFLPLDKIIIGDSKTWALRLNDPQRLEAFPYGYLDQIGMILIFDAVRKWCLRRGGVMVQAVFLAARRESVHPYDLVFEVISGAGMHAGYGVREHRAGLVCIWESQDRSPCPRRRARYHTG